MKLAAKISALLLLDTLASRAETILWVDNFETNAASRWTTNTAWKIGSPTTGPNTNASGFRSYAGSRCATTGLTGNAPANVDRRLVCTNYNGSPFLTIPDASQSPRLRFWQWFQFVNALGFVEVQIVGSTNWQSITPTNISVGGTASTSSGVWSRTSIDLGAFAGTNLLLAFHFISGASGFGNDLGWYVDDVALVTSTPVLNNPESFEASPSDWSVETGTWQIGKPTSGPATNTAGLRAHTGTNCAGTVLAGNYGWFVNTRLVTPPFTVPPSGSPALRFAQWYQFINALGYVEVSSSFVFTNFTAYTNYITLTNINTGTNFTTSTNVSAGVTNIITTTNTYAFTNINVIATNITTSTSISTNKWQTLSKTNISVGAAGISSGGWTNVSLDLSAFTGQTLRAAFHFESGVGSFGNAAGWYVDDISVVTFPVLTLPATQTITAGQNFSASASATNSLSPAAKYIFALTAASTNAIVATNGLITWTNTHPAIGTNILSVKVDDESLPPVSVTNSFSVIVRPAYQLSASNTLSKKYFLLTLQSLSNTTWRIDASTNLTAWQPVLTNLTGPLGTMQYTDVLATNFPFRFYRAVYP